MTTLPTGTVTFLFSDIEGSTQLWQDYPDSMPAALARHNGILRDAIQARQGHVFQVVGDGFCAAFATAPDALAAAVEIQRRLASAAQSAPAADESSPVLIRVRIGIHSGAAEAHDGAYLSNPTLIRVQRVMSAGHGGQTLLSDATETLARDALPPDARLQDMGRHRLKGLVRPEHLFQLNASGLPEQFPPLVTLDVFPNNLPTPLNSFVGREREIADIKRLLLMRDTRDPAEAEVLPQRLITLTGVGGTGKTRLALQVAAEVLESFPHGVWLVELAPIADAALVPQAVASVLTVREQPGVTPLDALTDHLRAKHLLLVLDNCEHLVEACARLTETLLRFCPKLIILATSREAIGIGGERTWFVPTLSQPDLQSQVAAAANGATANAQDLPAQLSQFESVRLFVDRARAALPQFALSSQNAAAVGKLCQHLDGIPLAIELAAARLKALSLEQIVARLDDRFNLLTVGSRTALPRQQTLRATIDWSYDLLSEDERRLFRRLSVFAGGWALEAAESVCGESLPVLDLLSQLVNKSLVVMDTHDHETHYHMLETIRQYAWERMAESGEALAVQRRHRDFYLRLAEQAEPKLRLAAQVDWLNRLDTDHDNLWVAMDWSLDQAEPLEALRLAGSLRCFFYLRDYWTQGRDWLQRALAAMPPFAVTADSGTPLSQAEREHIAARAKALAALGWLANDSGKEKGPYEQSLTLCRQIGDQWGMAFALRGLGVAAYNEGEFAGATKLLDDSLALFESLGEAWGTALVRFNQGWLAFEQDDRAGAQTLWEHSLAWFQRSTDRWGMAVALSTLSYAARLRGENLKAMLLAQESLTLFRELGDKSGISDSLMRLGLVAYRHENLKQTTDLLQESLTLQRQLGYERFATDSLVVLGHVASLQGDSSRASALLNEALTLARASAYAGGEARALRILGATAFHQKRIEEARAHFEASLKRFEEAKDAAGMASPLAELGWVSLVQGDHASAERFFQRSLALSRQGGEKPQIAGTLDGLGAVARVQGDLSRAQELSVKALTLRKETGTRRGIALSLESLAAIARLREQPARAVRLWAAASALRDEVGSPHSPMERAEFDAEVAALRAQLGDAAFEAAWSAGRALTLEQTATLALKDE